MILNSHQQPQHLGARYQNQRSVGLPHERKRRVVARISPIHRDLHCAVLCASRSNSAAAPVAPLVVRKYSAVFSSCVSRVRLHRQPLQVLHVRIHAVSHHACSVWL
jgi:hypothetical protein